MLHIKFGFDWPSGSEEKIFEIVDRQTTDGRTTDGRTPDHGHPISSPCEPNGSGELIKLIQLKIIILQQNKIIYQCTLFFFLFFFS